MTGGEPVHGAHIAARFAVDSGFHLESRALWVLVGEVLEGEVRAGMTIHMPQNGSLKLTGTVHGVEAVARQDRKPLVGLTFPLEHPRDALSWPMFTAPGEVLEPTGEEPVRRS